MMEREILGSTVCDDAIAATQLVLIEFMERETPMGQNTASPTRYLRSAGLIRGDSRITSSHDWSDNPYQFDPGCNSESYGVAGG